jgi:hypothetical protein
VYRSSGKESEPAFIDGSNVTLGTTLIAPLDLPSHEQSTNVVAVLLTARPSRTRNW